MRKIEKPISEAPYLRRSPYGKVTTAPEPIYQIRCSEEEKAHSLRNKVALAKLLAVNTMGFG